MAKHPDDENDEEAEDLADVEVERMPNLDGWEFFKAIDGGEGNERWTLSLKHAPEQGEIEYAFWTDIKADPSATGTLSVREEADKGWAKAVRNAVQHTEDRGLNDEARAEVMLAILRQHDSKLDDYEQRLLFTLDPLSAEEENDDDDDDDDE